MSTVRPGNFWIVFLAFWPGTVFLAHAASEPETATLPFVSRADSPPRKIVVGSALADFEGTLATRLVLTAKLIDEAGREARRKLGEDAHLDLFVLPEFALGAGSSPVASERAVELDGPVLYALGAKAREYRTWIIAPMTLREAQGDKRISNAAVLVNRAGGVAGIFRKVHPIADDAGVFEGGVTPGAEYPVFTCDFGRLGILICWDMAYEEAWNALAAGGAEIVALPSASPQTLRPMAEALRHHYFVINSAPRDNASVYDPIGRTIAQTTTAGVVVQQIDLAYGILHWSEALHNGKAFTDRFGAKAGYNYSEREDTGVFWSNDPHVTIGTMIRELGLHEMPDVIAAMENARRKQLLAPAQP